MFCIIVGWTILAVAQAVNPCDLMRMVNGSVVIDQATAVCLGACPVVDLLNNVGIYVSTQPIQWGSSLRLDGTDNGFSLTQHQGTVARTMVECMYDRCFHGTNAPSNYMDLPPNDYIMGTSVAVQFGPWLGETQIHLVRTEPVQPDVLGYDTWTRVRLSSDPTITGWLLRIGARATYVFTDAGTLVSGNATNAELVSNLGGSNVFAAGKTVVNRASITTGRNLSVAPLPPLNTDHIVKLRFFAGTASCSTYSMRKVTELVLPLTTDCYTVVDYPALASIAEGVSFSWPNTCSSTTVTDITLRSFTTTGCTGASVDTAVTPGTCHTIDNGYYMAECFNTL